MQAQRTERPPRSPPRLTVSSHQPGQSRLRIHLQIHSKTSQQPEAINFFLKGRKDCLKGSKKQAKVGGPPGAPARLPVCGKAEEAAHGGCSR